MKLSLKFKPDWLKLLFAFSVLYTNVISNRFFLFPGLSALLIYGSLMLACLQNRTLVLRLFRFEKTIILLAAFGFFNLLFSLITVVDRGLAFDTLSNFAEYVAGTVIMVVICKKDGSIRYAALLTIFIALSMGVLMMTTPVNFSENYTGRGAVYYTFASTVNPHSVAIIQMLGIWSALILQSYQTQKKGWHSLLTVGLILLFLFCIVLANSRKGILAALLLIVMAFKPYLKLFFSRLKKWNKLLLFGIVSLCMLWVILDGRMINYFLSRNNLLERLTTQMTGQSNQSRVALILEGLHTFAKHPLFGVGINNARYYSVYETYAELLACCGAVGSLPFIGFLYCTAGSLFRKAQASNMAGAESYRLSLARILFLVLLLTGFTQIIFYERGLMYALSTIVSYVYVLKAHNQ